MLVVKWFIRTIISKYFWLVLFALMLGILFFVFSLSKPENKLIEVDIKDSLMLKFNKTNH